MRIGLITGEYPPMQGGIADYTAQIAAHMQGHEVFILTSSRAAPNAPNVDAIIKNWNRAYFSQVGAWADQHQLDIVNLQYQTAAFNMAGLLHFYPSRFKAKFVTTFHDLRFPYLFPKAGDSLRRWFVWELARRSAGVISVNASNAQILAEKIRPRHLAQIPLGATVQVKPVPEGARAEVRAKLGLADSDFVVAHFGFINASKGVDSLIRAMADLKDLPARLLMIGERVGSSDPTNFAYAQKMDALAAELGIEPIWTGFADTDSLGGYFAAADVVALPFVDGVSLERTSLQAALAYGCTIISTPPAIPEFAHGENLFYSQDLAGDLRRLSAAPDLRQGLQMGAKEAAQKFDWAQITARILDFYAEVAKTPTSVYNLPQIK